MKKQTPTLHPTQQRYAAARALCEQAQAESRKAILGMNSDDGEAYIEAVEAVEEKWQVVDKIIALSHAETEMVEWSKEVTRGLPQYRANAVELEEMWKNVKKHPIQWKRLVELAFQLNPSL